MMAIYNKETIAAKLRRWDKYIWDFYLPTWDELPDFELYMDQVISLIGRFLDFLPHDGASEPVITPSTINNEDHARPREEKIHPHTSCISYHHMLAQAESQHFRCKQDYTHEHT